MIAMGMLPAAPAHPFRLEGDGNGREVLILGAGLAGMAAAYELGKLGYRCTMLEHPEGVFQRGDGTTGAYGDF